MHIKMDYGCQGLTINVPEPADVFTVRDVPAFSDEVTAIRQALLNPIQHTPIESLVREGMRVLIVHSDITRATPNDRLLPVIIQEIEKFGVKSKDITLINALGTHRAQTQQELIRMLGAEIVANYRCLQHDAFDQSQLKRLDGNNLKHPIMVNRLLFESDLIILTGFIEPHFFAGYSGGPKAILPALAGAESIFQNHNPGKIRHPKATFNQTEGNPIWEQMKAAADCVENTFLVNLTLNRENQITGVFAGDVIAAHAAGCKFVQDASLFRISEPYDLVITSNCGYPLDQNLYQCVKGMAAAKSAVREGGAILLLAACEEGLPDHGAYAQLLKEARSPEAILHKISQPGYLGQDSWQVQIHAQVLQHADVYMFSEGLDDDQISTSLLHRCHDLINDIPALIEKYGARVCILPQGPHTILEMAA
jgi:nickel-dependent lactate racemase